VRVAQPEALERLLDLDLQARHREAVAVERRQRGAMLGDGVHDRPLVGDEEVEIRIAALHVHPGA
jgi:hypothetical protein